jgi:hypothetical protein
MVLMTLLPFFFLLLINAIIVAKQSIDTTKETKIRYLFKQMFTLKALATPMELKSVAVLRYLVLLKTHPPMIQSQ